jgi:hypothetical protein
MATGLEMVHLLVFFPLGCSAVDASCDKTGFQRVNQYSWNDRDNWENNDYAYVQYDHPVDAHYLGIKGSYIAHEEGTHVFSVHRYVYADSIGLPNVEYRSEGQSTTITTSNNVWEDGPYTFHPYFRYPIFARYTQHNDKIDSDMTLRIRIPNGNNMTMNGANGGRACEESGCDDMSLSRTVWSCRPNPPSPSGSHSPSRTTSPNPTRTISHSQSTRASQTESPCETISQTEPQSRTVSQSESQSVAFDPISFTRSGQIIRTHLFNFLFIFP